MKFGNKAVSIKNLKEDYIKEYDFIKHLLERVNVPTEQSDLSDSDENNQDNTVEHLKNGTTRTERAKSLAELHARLATLREQKYTFKGKKLKNKLQNKLKRKKKVQENKSKRNVSAKDHDIHSLSLMNDLEAKPPKPVFNSSGNLVFSKFDLLGETTTVPDRKLLTKDKSNKKQLLEKLEKNKNFIKKLEESGETAKANQIKEETKWNDVIKKAEGIKVKDDPTLLKKSIAKKQAQKKASEKKWKERLKTVEKQKEDRQKKRKENIDKRIQDKKKKRLKRAIKKGRYTPNAV